MQNMDKLLKEVFAEIVEERYENRPKEVPKHRFSLKFKMKMYWLMHKVGIMGKSPEREGSILELYRPVHSKRRLVVLVLLMVMLLGGTVVAAQTIMYWLHEVILEQHDDHLKIYNPNLKAEEESTTTPEVEEFHKYRLTEIPEGYRLVEEEYKADYELYQVTYENLDGCALILKQGREDNGNFGNVSSDSTEMEKIKINNFQGYYVKDVDMASLVLSDGEYLIQLFGEVSKKEFISLAESLE